MPRKGLSLRRQNQLAALDPDLPLLKIRALEKGQANHHPVQIVPELSDVSLPVLKPAGDGLALPEPAVSVAVEASKSERTIDVSSIGNQLRMFFIEHNISNAAANELLRILNPYISELPLDVTMLQVSNKEVMEKKPVENEK